MINCGERKPCSTSMDRYILWSVKSEKIIKTQKRKTNILL